MICSDSAGFKGSGVQGFKVQGFRVQGSEVQGPRFSVQGFMGSAFKGLRVYRRCRSEWRTVKSFCESPLMSLPFKLGEQKKYSWSLKITKCCL